nr:MAG TPA: stabilization protein [Bacteriophage sp.]
MGLINQDIKNLVSGVSQQPPILRHPEQLEEQLNGYSSEAGGLQKRPPSILVSNLGRKINDSAKPLVHFIDRDVNEKYIVLFTGSDIEIYDMQGNRKTVNFASGTKPYIYTQLPRYNLKPITIADYTFICNTLQKTKMADTIDNNSWDVQGLLVNIKSGQYGRTYRIDVNGTTIASHETPDGSDKSHTKLITTDYIAQQLATKAKDNGFAVTTGSSWLYLKKTAFKTVTGETVYLQPTTSPVQQEDRFKGLAFTGHFHTWSAFPTVITRNGYTITVKFPTEENLRANSNESFDSDYAAYEKMVSEITRCQNDKWEVTNEVITQQANGLKLYSTMNVYTLTWTVSTSIPSNSKAYSLIDSATVYDGYNNQAAFGILKFVQKFSNLPVNAPDGFTVKITGEEGSSTDDYYVSYVAEDQVWRECARPSMKNHIDNTTMPHVLVREADGTFTFKCADWSVRDVGDEDSNPEPSFIGGTINDVFYHRNRLGFLSGENIILTRSADFFNFWMTSATKVQDTDPIDLAVSDNTISTLYNAVTFDTDLILFSQEAQFMLSADGVLTPTSANLSPAVTHYEASLKAKPVNAGRNVYFVAERAKYTTVREFFTAADNTDAKDVQDITSHVPNYIPNGVYKIIPSTVENVMLYLTEGDETSIYVYKYLFIDSQRVQAAWSKWDMQGVVYGGQFIDNYLYLIVERNGYYCLEKISFTINTTDFDSEAYRILLDCKHSYQIPADCYDSLNDETTVSVSDIFGDIYEQDRQYSAVAPDGTYAKAKEGKLVFIGDYSNQVLTVGINYNFKIVMSTIMVKQSDNGSTQALIEGRLQLRQMWFNYADSGYFKVTVDIKDKQAYVYEYTSRLLGTRFNILGAMPFTTGSFKFPIQAKNENVNICLETDTPLPVSLVGAGWIGNYQRRTRLF